MVNREGRNGMEYKKVNKEHEVDMPLEEDKRKRREGRGKWMRNGMREERRDGR